MADNLVIDEGTSSKSAATDEISSNLHVPKVKVLDATTDSTNGWVVDSAGHGQVDEQNSGSIKTAVELIDDAVYADDADWTDSTSKHVLVGGLYQSTPQTITDGDVGPLQTDSTGKLLIGNSSIAGTAGTPNAGVLSVQGITSMTPVQVTVNSITAGDNNIGNVDIASALPSGTNAIGKLAANSGVDIGDVDVLSLPARTAASMIQWSTYSNSYTSAQTSQDIVAASGSTKIYVGYLSVSCNYNTSNAGRTTVQIYFGTGAVSDTSKHVWRGTFAPVPATSVEAYPGVVIGNGAAPFFISAASDALKITTTTSGTHCGVSVTVSYIQV